MPSLPIPYGIPGSGLLAHVLVAKFDDHLPYYRQSEIYAKHVCAGQTLHVDDTTVPVLDPGSGKTKTRR